MRTRSRSATCALAAAVALFAAGCSSSPAPSSGQDEPAPGISTQATGTVTGTPDTVTVVLAVQTQASSANAALADNADKANAVIDLLKGKGIAAEDIKTSNLNLRPQHGPDQQITGYQVTNEVTATVHDISKAGPLIDAAAGAAGDAIRVRQTGFSISDDSDLRAQARAEAVTQAQDQAKQIAEAAGVDLGSVRSIAEVPAQAGPPQPLALADRAATATPVEPGSQDVTVKVDVVYDIG
ncbi:SIMPL domain-containing protein [Tomitella cavernea]|uniref:SIMPL domain-containing protein n=1 Tax=Tomitella cavernea TaxID=1387982 RepID=A0ABP9D3N5_9ACTN|nr:SIMPL domain-containing protein [Tomitella cavernea]